MIINCPREIPIEPDPEFVSADRRHVSACLAEGGFCRVERVGGGSVHVYPVDGRKVDREGVRR